MHANRSERERKCAWRWNEKDVERPFCSVLMMDAAMVLCGVRLPNKKVSERDHIFLHPFFRYPLSREKFLSCVCRVCVLEGFVLCVPIAKPFKSP